jgi:hypothetical protein
MAPTASKHSAQKPVTSANASNEPPKAEELPTVNRKKQKRRQKQAAKLAAEQSNSPMMQSNHTQNGHLTYDSDQLVHKHDISESLRYEQTNGHDSIAGDGDDLFYSEEEPQLYDFHKIRSSKGSQAVYRFSSEHSPHNLSNGKTKKKKKKPRADSQQNYNSAYPIPGSFQPPPPPPPPPPPSNSNTNTLRASTKDRIWNTSTAEERERIKEFWISLAEPERRSLVKVEKEAVLKKMKEQQKHSCSCSVCGRKRNAIEEELEVLYDAYYEELEQYANHRQLGVENGHPMMPPPSSYTSMAKVSLRQNHRVMNSQPPNPHPMAGTFEDDDQLEDEVYSDEEDDEDDDESEGDYYPPEVNQGPATDFFNFGKSLTVQGKGKTVWVGDS